MKLTREVASLVIVYMIPAAVAWSLSPRLACKVAFAQGIFRKPDRKVPWGDSFFRLYSSSAAEVNEKKRVVFLGTPEVAATTLRTIYQHSRKEDSHYDLVAVITQPAKKQGRTNKLVPSPVAVAAAELGLPVMCPAKVGETRQR
jgi:hypothetical protein